MQKRRPAVAGRVAGLLGVAGCLAAAPAEANFYEVARGELAGRPGSIIRTEPIAGAPGGASAFRVLYRSTGLKGEPIAVSGVVVIPAGAAPAGGRPVVAWAHGTSGVAQKCAPSLRPDFFRWVYGLDDMLKRGYVVTATDYPGLGTEGPHPYLVGVSEGRALLDSVRAARALPGANAGSRFAVWGHSQGGHASLFAGQLAQSYAPELRLAGVATAAPATELGELFLDEIGGPVGKILGSFTLWSWSRVYGVPLDGVVLARSMLVVERVAGLCIETERQDMRLFFAEQPLEREGFLAVDITKTEPWRRLIAENVPGQAPAGAPVFIAQGSADSVVRPAVTAQFMEGLCRRGTPVRLVVIPGGDHDASARYGAAPAVAWIADRFADRPAPDDCRR